MRYHPNALAVMISVSCLLIACGERAPTEAVTRSGPRNRVEPATVRSAIVQLQATAKGMQEIRNLRRLSPSEDAALAVRIDNALALAERLGRPGPKSGLRAMMEPYESEVEGVINEAESSTSIFLGGTTNKIYSHTSLSLPAGQVGHHITGTTTTNGTSYPIDADRGSGVVPVIAFWDSEVDLPEIDCNAHSAGVVATTDHTATWFILGWGPRIGYARTVANRPIDSPECPYVGPSNAHFEVFGAGQSGSNGLNVTASGAVTFSFSASVTVGDAPISSYQWTATTSSGTVTFGSGATASYTTAQPNTGIRLIVTDGRGKTSVVDGAVNITLEDETSEPSPCGTQIIYDPATCDASSGGGSGGNGGGGDDPQPGCTYFLVTPIVSFDGGITWERDYSRQQYIIEIC